MNSKSGKGIEVLKIKCLRIVSGVRWFDREEQQGQRCMIIGVACWRPKMLKCYGLIDRVEEKKMTMTIYRS